MKSTNNVQAVSAWIQHHITDLFQQFRLSYLAAGISG
jgi:hypothetical protein